MRFWRSAQLTTTRWWFTVLVAISVLQLACENSDLQFGSIASAQEYVSQLSPSYELYYKASLRWAWNTKLVESELLNKWEQAVRKSTKPGTYLSIKVDRIVEESKWIADCSETKLAAYYAVQADLIDHSNSLHQAILDRNRPLTRDEIKGCKKCLDELRKLNPKSEMAALLAFHVLELIYSGGEDDFTIAFAKDELAIIEVLYSDDARMQLFCQRAIAWATARKGNLLEGIKLAKALHRVPPLTDLDYTHLLLESYIPIIRLAHEHGERECVVQAWALVGDWFESYAEDTRPSILFQDEAVDWKMGVGKWSDLLTETAKVRPTHIPDSLAAKSLVTRAHLLRQFGENLSAEEQLSIAWDAVNTQSEVTERKLLVGKAYVNFSIEHDKFLIARTILDELKAGINKSFPNDRESWRIWCAIAQRNVAPNSAGPMSSSESDGLEASVAKYLGGRSEFRRELNILNARTALENSQFKKAFDLLRRVEEWDDRSFYVPYSNQMQDRLALQIEAASGLKDEKELLRVRDLAKDAQQKSGESLRVCEPQLRPFIITQGRSKSRFSK